MLKTAVGTNSKRELWYCVSRLSRLWNLNGKLCILYIVEIMLKQSLWVVWNAIPNFQCSVRQTKVTAIKIITKRRFGSQVIYRASRHIIHKMWSDHMLQPSRPEKNTCCQKKMSFKTPPVVVTTFMMVCKIRTWICLGIETISLKMNSKGPKRVSAIL